MILSALTTRPNIVQHHDFELIEHFAYRYNSNKAHQHEVDDMMEAMEQTLYEHGVDAVFAGHVHAYESSYPVFR